MCERCPNCGADAIIQKTCGACDGSLIERNVYSQAEIPCVWCVNGLIDSFYCQTCDRDWDCEGCAGQQFDREEME